MSSVGYRDCNGGTTPGSPGSRKTEIPTGDTNCSNLQFTTSNNFVEGSLEVYNDGIRLIPGVEYSEGGNLKSFTLILTPGSSELLSEPPESTERILVSYTISS